MIHPEIHPGRAFGGGEAGLGDLESAKYVVVPAPLEKTVSYGSGTSNGPAALIRASAELEFFCDEKHRPYWENGDVVTLPAPFGPNATSEEARAALEECVREIATRELFPITLGGEHAITSAPVKALAETAGEPFGVLFIDAHLDLRDEYDGSKWSHASVGRRIVDDLGLPCAWLGIRSVSAEEHRVVEDRGFTVAHAHEIRARGLEPEISRVLAALPDRVYLTFDVDGLDPSVVPGTGTPEPGGLSYPQALEILRRLTAAKTLVGADFVELAPIEGQQGSEFSVAKLIAKLIGEL